MGGGKGGTKGVLAGGIKALAGIPGVDLIVLADDLHSLDPAVAFGNDDTDLAVAGSVLALGLGGAGQTEARRQHAACSKGENHHPEHKALAIGCCQAEKMACRTIHAVNWRERTAALSRGDGDFRPVRLPASGARWSDC